MFSRSLSATLRYFNSLIRGWDAFWFTPADPTTLCFMRICAGLMLLYTHSVWSIDLLGFFGTHGRISPEFAHAFADAEGIGAHFAWSYLHFTQSPTLLWLLHAAAIIVLVMLTVGLFTRVNSVLALIITISYVHRAPGAQFGLDQINVMLAMYLAIGPSGACLSLDQWLRKKRGIDATVRQSTSANIAIRLVQLHLCVIYLFAGLGKLIGISWWEGTALWRSLASYEYQSIDMLWIANTPWLINLLTHVTLAWEISYAFLVWPKATRPIVLALAIPIHLGIAFCMGMVTFGTIMLVANLAFVSPVIVRSALGLPSRHDNSTLAARGT